MIICTENDKNFIKYKDIVNNRKVVFSIKQIFKDWWHKFLDTYPNLNIRDVAFSNVERMLKCKTWDLGFAIFSCPISDKNFKQIRFYGAYHNSTKITIDIVKFLSEEKAKVMKSLNTWKAMITLSFSINPLNCPICNTFMEYNKSTYP